MKFEAIGELGVAGGQGQRPIAPKVVNEIAVAVVDNAVHDHRSSSSAGAMSRQLNIPWSTVQKVLRTIRTRFISHKS